MNFTAHGLKNMILNREIKVEEVVKLYLDRIDSLDCKVDAYLYVSSEEALKRAKELDKKLVSNEKKGGLFGIPISIKDNISVAGMQNTCASKMLKGYISPYDASVIERIKQEDGIILGKLNMDEFAMGSSTETSYFKTTKNPWNLEMVPGGSSGGSAASLAADEALLSLGTDTGGSVRQPAALCGVVGLKPTYGRISRYGSVAFGSTLDQIGPMAKNVEDCALLTENIAGLDNKDFTTADVKVSEYTNILTDDIRGKKIGIPKEYFGEGLNSDVKKCVEKAIDVFRQNGVKIEYCALPLSTYSLAAYYIIGCAEASSNLARFDGIRYGYRSKDYADAIDIYTKSRSEGFGDEVKKRIMLGTYVLSKGYYDEYYKKALKARNLIKREFVDIMKKFDAIICPTTTDTAFKIGEKQKDNISMYLSDLYIVPSNVTGVPSISIPCGMVNGLPVGMQITSNYFREDLLFNLAYSFEQSTNWHNLKPNI
ncbi:Asp-tRNA(Asn)/Glu-tRNA(Gln) amidotransferase subunit GatA [Clostridium tyrobutyricum]|jgi:aspartyl-tRNA(Asn)/glutamyl-tRNA(Gln) amidotransferase subunit A|uniref:Glutamyl-tRNA(Gln) amidotransferase subunit A n=2 Tax=Clostridium tyrobutyricum TaxID=1519 RepID=W6NIC2_CLOTY|nr:Asp-tRNA(Asn)/Glu-tRNA(Gln) amidotransferase subunit GatA [Clostridium tyrobutyricum]AND85852.1 aspartyl/glutamyl-tRNA(Asn/Gln) amidotransferase subunit A [Clostridium tyrobutyricum]ANP70364.1 aspartyl/glutamyl-tRNA amidotransferase subunit A [Clostridium tyrobutyricum]MBV4414606.1 Asp-tRNA(Asn)/Glu-tRNA(Gln) amidotransferase subunit GatA [Clostridium tyrobutyricum]MBV4423578.1 Asp-tRNA(Asn)/Glu-tRNA(Gln) amidotransferase subunit GatA [Clostridium tyrobutyricum]MBV4428577.1 Asp-tRNA(Asn)/Gl